jgi:hypothetical protein
MAPFWISSQDTGNMPAAFADTFGCVPDGFVLSGQNWRFFGVEPAPFDGWCRMPARYTDYCIGSNSEWVERAGVVDDMYVVEYSNGENITWRFFF